MSLSTDDKAITGTGGSGGRGPSPRKEILFLLILILVGVIYTCIMVTNISHGVSYLTGTDSSGVKPPRPK